MEALIGENISMILRWWRNDIFYHIATIFYSKRKCSTWKHSVLNREHTCSEQSIATKEITVVKAYSSK